MKYEDQVSPIHLIPVQSSQIKAIGYDSRTRTMAVQFNKGAGHYRYSPVDSELFEKFRKSPSMGSFLHQNIKKAGIPHELIVPKKEGEEE